MWSRSMTSYDAIKPQLINNIISIKNTFINLISWRLSIFSVMTGFGKWNTYPIRQLRYERLRYKTMTKCVEVYKNEQLVFDLTV